MGKRHLQVVGTVTGVAVAAFLLYDLVLGLTRGFQWLAVVEGSLVAAAVLAVWNVAVTRGAAAIGLGVAVVVALVGWAGVPPAVSFVQEPVGWAVLLTLLIRFAAPATVDAAGVRREPGVRTP